MSANTLKHAQTLVTSYKNSGMTAQESLTEFQAVMENEEALAGIVSGLEDMEAGRVTRVTPESLKQLRSDMIKQLGL